MYHFLIGFMHLAGKMEKKEMQKMWNHFHDFFKSLQNKSAVHLSKLSDPYHVDPISIVGLIAKIHLHPFYVDPKDHCIYWDSPPFEMNLNTKVIVDSLRRD